MGHGVLPPMGCCIHDDSKPNDAAPLRASGSAALERLQLVQASRPIRAEQARQSPIGEQLSARLTAGTIIRLLVGVADTLHRITAARARLAVAPVYRHL